MPKGPQSVSWRQTGFQDTIWSGVCFVRVVFYLPMENWKENRQQISGDWFELFTAVSRPLFIWNFLLCLEFFRCPRFSLRVSEFSPIWHILKLSSSFYHSWWISLKLLGVCFVLLQDPIENPTASCPGFCRLFSVWFSFCPNFPSII